MTALLIYKKRSLIFLHTTFRERKATDMSRTILHSDCNCFYASVELLHHPELRGRPVAVCGNPEARHGIILTADYTAKRYGVKTGMALWQARQLCPDLIFLPARMDLYLRFSRMAQEIYSEYTDKVEPYGIDESWLDVSDSVSIKGDGYSIAKEINNRMKKELGITVSIGVSFNKVFAKLGSDYESILTKKFGKVGNILHAFANGYDTSPVKIENTSAPIKSVGNSTTTPKDMRTDEDVKIVLYILAESVAARLRENGFRCRTVEISIRDKELFHFSKQTKLKNASNITGEIAEAAYMLYKKSYSLPANEYELKRFGTEFYQKPLRSIGISGSDLVTDFYWEQMDIFMDPKLREKRMKMDVTVDNIRKRFGFYSIQRGLMYRDSILSACNAKEDHTVHPIGYFG